MEKLRPALAFFFFLICLSLFLTFSPLFHKVKPLHVIYSSKIKSAREFQYICDVLQKDIGREVIFHDWPDFNASNPQSWRFRSDSLVFGFHRTAFGIPLDDYVNEMNTRQVTNVGLFHMGDEMHNFPLDFYSNFDYVVRHYYYEDIFKEYPNSMWLANGYSTGVGPKKRSDLIPASKRPTKCYFQGRTTYDRLDFLRELNNSAPNVCTLSLTSSFAKGLSAEEFAKELSNSAFALCPDGNIPETIRFYEVLECGSIPVLVKSSFTESLEKKAGPLPFVLLNKWKEFLPKVTSIENIDRLQQQVIDWWAKLQHDQKRELRRRIKRSFEKHAKN